MSNSKHVLLTGMPGVGKTTLVHKVCDLLKNKGVSIQGFYTQEVRNEHNKRIGFDVVTLDGKHGRLARSIDLIKPNEITRYKVGNYVVFPNEFESLVLPSLKYQPNVVFVIDEIGKMELFSSAFIKNVSELLDKANVKILATIPVHRGNPLPLVEKLRERFKEDVITVDRNNRNGLLEKIVDNIV